MYVTVSFRIPKELREKMREVNVSWSEEIRRFIARRVEEEMRKKHLEAAVSTLRETGGVERGFASSSVREDRDGG